MTLRYRTCHNCCMSTYMGWPYCDDCLRMASKALFLFGVIVATVFLVVLALSVGLP